MTVERCGENLLDEARFPIIKTQNNIKTTSEMTLPAGTYTVCVLSVANGVYARGADVESTYNSNKHTFALARQTAITLDSYWTKGRPEKDENIWLVEGNEWRPYTPYIGSTNTLTLPETVYGGEVDAVSGDGQETWKALNNFNNYTFSEGDSEAGWTQSEDAVAWFTNDLQAASNESNVLSNVLHAISNIVTSAVPYTIGATTTYCALRLPRSVAATGDDVKNWLNVNDAKIAFKGKEQTLFTATGAQPISALAGVNTVLTDADSATVTGRADPIKRITDLEDAVASQT